VYQPLILRGERSGLLTRIVATVKRFIVRADEKLTAFAFRRFPCLFCGS